MRRLIKNSDQVVDFTMETELEIGDMNDKVDEDGLPGNEKEEEVIDELSVCALCENGGELLSCEGDCLRSFHPTIEAGSCCRPVCKSLGLTKEQVEAIPVFYCENCLHKQHQCFACGELGSSDKSSGAEVFLCASGDCGRFYHAHCVAERLYCQNEAEVEELEQKIVSGEPFTCPSHVCADCRGIEVHEDPELQFGICQRCPNSYHRKCLPRTVKLTRSWDNLLPNNRILIFCLKHDFDNKLKTPKKNHIKFPISEEKKNRQVSQLMKSRGKLAAEENRLASKDASGERLHMEPPKVDEKVSSAVIHGKSSKKRPGVLSNPESSKKRKVPDTVLSPLHKNPSEDSNKPVKTMNDNTGIHEHEQKKTEENVMNEASALPPLDADTQRRIINIMRDAASSVTLDDIMRLSSQKVPMTHSCSSRNAEVKSITLGKVELSIEALHDALRMLEQGLSVEKAKAVCGPEILKEINVWKDKLKVYLAPFLHGPRYTSYGRHFTKEEKLEEIVNLLHWYVQEGDMIVDFCCGANDFSCLMKKKLEKMGKKCHYKNYDAHQAKNGFNFEQRDWMTVETNELPCGSQLIMGLNPPFGVNNSLANKLINHALKFKPKLLVIIAPPETKRLDVGHTPYDLVWRDDEMLSGKSFYLPGSVDVNEERIEQWNVTPPPLYLWSRGDWSAHHRAIAADKHGHLSDLQENVDNNHLAVSVFDSLKGEHELDGEIPMPVDNHHSVQEEKREQVDHAPGFPTPLWHRDVVEAAEFMNTSTMDRYAPRLDELNHARIRSTSGFEPFTQSNRVVYNSPVSGSEGGTNLMGFALSVRQPFSQNSAGWIEE